MSEDFQEALKESKQPELIKVDLNELRRLRVALALKEAKTETKH